MQYKSKRKYTNRTPASHQSDYKDLSDTSGPKSAPGKSLFIAKTHQASNSAVQIKYKNQDDLLKVQSKQNMMHQKKETGFNSNSSSNAKTSPSTDNSHDAMMPDEIYDFMSQNQHTDTDYVEASCDESKRSK